MLWRVDSHPILVRAGALSLFAAIVVAAALSRPADSQNAAAARPKTVIVGNTKAQAVPVAPQGTANVQVMNSKPIPVTVSGGGGGGGTVQAEQSGAWSVGVTGTVPAVQSGAWNVGISGTVAAAQSGAWSVSGVMGLDPMQNVVRVQSSGASPVFVRDTASSTPFSQAVVINVPAAQRFPPVAAYTVPPGKRLVIESIHCAALAGPNDGPFAVLKVEGANFHIPLEGPGFEHFQSLGTRAYSAVLPVRIYVEPGQDLELLFTRTGRLPGDIEPPTIAAIECRISGYLVDP